MAGGVEGGEVAGPCISSAGRGTVTEKVTSKQNLEGCQLAELECRRAFQEGPLGAGLSSCENRDR